MVGTMEDWERRNMLLRICLHRWCAIATIFVVYALICVNELKFHVASTALLVPTLILELWWHHRHIGIREKGERGSSRVEGYIGRTYELKYEGQEYPAASLFVEAVVLASVCTITGGYGSPFIALFAIFGALALYVSGQRKNLQSGIYVVVICACFTLAVALGNTAKSRSWLAVTSLAEGRASVQYLVTLSFVFIYSTGMSGWAFKKISENAYELEESLFNVSLEQTMVLLNTIKKKKNLDIDYSPLADGKVFLIEASEKQRKRLEPKKTLALLPYCSRGAECPIRVEDTYRIDKATSEEICRHTCRKECGIGRMHREKGRYIAEVKVIGSSHKVEKVVQEFLKGRDLTHVIAVCCPSNLAKYLPKGMDTHKGLTVIYAPILRGSETCVSALDPKHHDRPLGELPCTSFDVDALLRCLGEMTNNNTAKHL